MSNSPRFRYQVRVYNGERRIKEIGCANRKAIEIVIKEQIVDMMLRRITRFEIVDIDE